MRSDATRRLRSLWTAVSVLALTFPALLLRPDVAGATTARWLELPRPTIVGWQAVYDTVHHRGLLISARSSVWALSGDPAPVWTKVWDGLGGPYGASYAYDPARDCLWAFTMTSGKVPVYPGRLWRMDLAVAAPAWMEQTVTGMAPRLTSFAFALDPPRSRVVVFGGNTGCVGCETNAVSTLALSNAGGVWSAATPLGTPPTQRVLSSAFYDPVRDRMLFHGGLIFGPTLYDETWALSLSDPMTWTFLTPTGSVPPARASAFAGADATGQRGIVSGGTDAVASFNDTWSLNLSLSAPADAAAWTQVAGGTAAAPGRSEAVYWLDTGAARVLRYGGTAGAERRSDLWALSLGSEPAWAMITPDSLRPPIRHSHLAFASVGEQTWWLASGNPDDAWARPTDPELAAAWQPGPGDGPGTRYWAGSARDSAGGRALVFGGSSADQAGSTGGTEYADLWEFTFGVPGWNPLLPASTPSVRAEALTLFDDSRGRLIVHGGRYTATGKIRPRSDTWVWDAVTNTWSTLPAGTFGGRWGETGIVDPVRDRMVAFGGMDTLMNYADVHVLPLVPGGAWSPLVTTGTPPPVTHPRSLRAAYDGIRDRMIVLASDDTLLRAYALTLGATPTWSVVAVHGDSPRPRRDYAAVGDLRRGRVLVAGGEDPISGGNPIDEEWVLVLDETTPVLVSLVSTDVSADRVRIEWSVDMLTAGPITAWRRRGGGAWEARSVLAPDGAGHVRLEDADVQPGDRLEYRLGVTIDGEERFLGDVAVEIPIAPALRISGAWPNPSTDGVLIAFALPDAAHATIELLDVSGRRVLEKAVGPFGAGSHVLRVGPGKLKPGVYFARLTRGPVTRMAKVVVLE